MAGKITFSETNNATRIEWKINHIFIREDNLIVSPDFILFKSKWFLQLHLGSKLTFCDTENDSCEPLRMSLLTLNPTTKYYIKCRMGIKACNGSEITTEKFEWVLNKRCGQTPQRLKLISRKDFDSSRNTLITKNTLTVFCIVRLMNVINPPVDNPSLITSTDSDISSSILLFCDEREMAGDIILDDSKIETRIEWRINDFSNRKNYLIESPDFILFNSKWLLKIKYADEFIKSFSKPDVVSDSFLSMGLEISSDLKTELHIKYEMGIQMSNGSQIRTGNLEALITSRFDQSLKERKIISRKDFESVNNILDSKNSLKAFCTVRLLSDNSLDDITLLDFKCSNYDICNKSSLGEITLDKSELTTRIEWTIKYFFVKQKRLIQSPDFMLFNSNWFLLIIDDNFFLPVIGNGNASKKSLFMCLDRDHCSTDDHHIEYRMGIKRSDGSEVLTEKFESVFQPRFMKSFTKRELISGKGLENLRHTLTLAGTLKVFCAVRLVSEDKPVEILQLPIKSTQGTVPSSENSKNVCLCKGIHTLSEDLEELYKSRRFTDMTIKVKGIEFLAHKAILSIRSEVFAAMFEHDTSEKRNSVVDITDCDPHSFENFLLYLYTGKLDTVSSSNATSLFRTADKYGVGELKEECVRYMIREITMDSFSDIFHLAALHGELDLLKTATNFFICNANAILITKEWMALLEEYPSLCNELLVKFTKSSSVLYK